MRIDQSFRELVDPDDLGGLDQSGNTIYAVWPDFRLAFTNAAWDRMATENGATGDFFERWAVGASIREVFEGPGGERFHAAAISALESGRTRAFTYECSSSQRFRLLRAHVLPFADKAVLFSHAVITTSSHADIGRTPAPPDRHRYTAEDGLVRMCSGCRCVQQPDEPDRWDWVPEFVDRMPANTSHSWCAACMSCWMSPVAPGADIF